MPVEVDAVRAVSVPTRLVHGPGAVSAVADEAVRSASAGRCWSPIPAWRRPVWSTACCGT